MIGSFTKSQPRRAARRWQQMSGMVGVLALGVALAGLIPSTAHAQKDINFNTTGSVRSTLLFSNQIHPDTYYFFATAGEYIRLQTSNLASGLDTTIRVVGPNAATSLFDDDSGGGYASRLVFYAGETGAYIVVVSSYYGTPGGGDYTLTFARGAYAYAASAAADDTHNQSMDPGEAETHTK
jgi:hypothetical protein